MKVCSRCKQLKPLTEFYKDARTSNGHKSACIGCYKHLKNVWPSKTKSREYRLRSLYNIEPEQFDALIKQQNYKCKICGEITDQLYVDHCHATEKVRGLLCQYCNTLLGLAKENPKILLGAIQYLTENNN